VRLDKGKRVRIQEDMLVSALGLTMLRGPLALQLSLPLCASLVPSMLPALERKYRKGTRER